MSEETIETTAATFPRLHGILFDLFQEENVGGWTPGHMNLITSEEAEHGENIVETDVEGLIISTKNLGTSGTGISPNPEHFESVEMLYRHHRPLIYRSKNPLGAVKYLLFMNSTRPGTVIVFLNESSFHFFFNTYIK